MFREQAALPLLNLSLEAEDMHLSGAAPKIIPMAGIICNLNNMFMVDWKLFIWHCTPPVFHHLQRGKCKIKCKCWVWSLLHHPFLSCSKFNFKGVRLYIKHNIYNTIYTSPIFMLCHSTLYIYTLHSTVHIHSNPDFRVNNRASIFVMS